jgi:hypothetical protein
LLVVASSPLYVIAHDWGRFAIHTFLLSMIVSLKMPKATGITKLPILGRLTYKLWLLGEIIGRTPAPLYFVPIMFWSHGYYRVNGLLWDNSILLISSMLLVITYNARSASVAARAYQVVA